MSRINFSNTTAKQIAQAAMYICSNPRCLRFTGYGTSEGKPRAVAEAAHILPAGEKGPRAAAKADRAIAGKKENGIWLCKICHGEIDDDPKRFPSELLKKWKADHEEVVRRIVGKDLERAIVELRELRQYHDECREVLSFFEDKRALYASLDAEFPPRVLDSLQEIRQKVVSVRARVARGTVLYDSLNGLQNAVHRFLEAMGPETDLRELRCDSTNPLWNKFAHELEKLRIEFSIIVKVLAQQTDYNVHWLDGRPSA